MIYFIQTLPLDLMEEVRIRCTTQANVQAGGSVPVHESEPKTAGTVVRTVPVILRPSGRLWVVEAQQTARIVGRQD